jgi:biopolymer transport protein ExbD
LVRTMIFAGKLRTTAAADLRTRYSPKSRIGHGLISVAPWVNIVLLMIFMLMLDRKFVLQPGYVVDLPRGPFRAGTRSELAVIVRSVSQASSGARKELVYFNDQRFLVNDAEQMKNLQNALARCPIESKVAGLVVFADTHVNVDTLVKVFNMAMEVGIRKVNVASKAEGESAGGGT